MASFQDQSRNDYRQNHGVPGVVYILENPAFKAGFFKIGCTRRSGSSRANDLNKDANTGTPALFRCVFECRTLDCGQAEEIVFNFLSQYRHGKWGQEFFEIDLEMAKDVIIGVCKSVDKDIREAYLKQPICSPEIDPTYFKSPEIPQATVDHGADRIAPTTFKRPETPSTKSVAKVETRFGGGIKVLLAVSTLVSVLVLGDFDKQKDNSSIDQDSYKQMSASARALSDVAVTQVSVLQAPQTQAWIAEMSARLAKWMPDKELRVGFLQTLYYEATRAGLDPGLMLGIIEVESGFSRFAVSKSGERGYMQIAPEWLDRIGMPEHNLFDLRTNLRYGALIMRHYIDMEKGDLFLALGRYNGSLGNPVYPSMVVDAWQKNWRN